MKPHVAHGPLAIGSPAIVDATGGGGGGFGHGLSVGTDIRKEPTLAEASLAMAQTLAGNSPASTTLVPNAHHCPICPTTGRASVCQLKPPSVVCNNCVPRKPQADSGSF